MASHRNPTRPDGDPFEIILSPLNGTPHNPGCDEIIIRIKETGSVLFLRLKDSGDGGWKYDLEGARLVDENGTIILGKKGILSAQDRAVLERFYGSGKPPLGDPKNNLG